MRRVVLIALLVVATALGLAPAATADVHGVSQAGCAADGAPSGAIASQHAIDEGRPAAPIPVTASDGRTQGQGGAAGAQGANC